VRPDFRGGGIRRLGEALLAGIVIATPGLLDPGGSDPEMKGRSGGSWIAASP
jgi:hypothetical protein